jgi:hypothetical protein
MHIRKNIYFIICLILTSCANQSIQLPLPLASFTENSVSVSIVLEEDTNGQFYISATFTPSDGLHLYSKDIPLTGVNGLGRPTLLSLPETSQLISTGELIESVESQTPDFEPKELMVYPSGAVTLSLPVEIPVGNAWIQESVLVTYMACNEIGCKPPVLQKEVLIQIPSLDLIKEQQ